MTNTELMKTFFYDLPEKIFAEGRITKEQFDALTNKDMIWFIDNLHMDYPTKELQEQFEQNKATWKLCYEMPKDTEIKII